jgi:hypothetical protein
VTLQLEVSSLPSRLGLSSPLLALLTARCGRRLLLGGRQAALSLAIEAKGRWRQG